MHIIYIWCTTNVLITATCRSEVTNSRATPFPGRRRRHTVANEDEPRSVGGKDT